MGNRGRPRPGQHRADTRLPTGTRSTAQRSAPGRAERRRIARRAKRRRRRSALKEIPILIGVALLIALVLKTFLVQAFVIPTGSMEQTIRIGDRVLVDKLTPWFGWQPQRGDIVVFKDPGGWLESDRTTSGDDPVGIKQGKQLLTFIGLLPSEDEQDLIKRVVAVGGDTVRCCDADGRITVNGRPLDEPYLHPGNAPSETRFEVQVPPGRLFVLGDHRERSADSRFHLDEEGSGTVAENLVVGRAVVIAWPFGHWRWLEEPETFATVPDARGAGASAAAPAHRVSPRAPSVPAEADRPIRPDAAQEPLSSAAAGTAARQEQATIQLPTPAELPLVMGVVGLHRVRRRRQRGVRSGCGGFGGRRTVGVRRAREAARGAR
ncbi:signal peptidase I [Streptomyces sp. URMC 123]|uniref:signal peptidase I n=1 Tax=Streptomyces sp. URMC 123 TaxID=3423403 RepID=UPI003F1D53B4